MGHLYRLIRTTLKCEGKEFTILTTASLKDSYYRKFIPEDIYLKLRYGSIPLKEFNAKTTKELELQFQSRYSESLKGGKVSVSPKRTGSSEGHVENEKSKPIKENYTIKIRRNKDLPHTNEWIIKGLDEAFVKDKDILEMEKGLNHLKRLANKHYLEIPEERCDQIIKMFEQEKDIQNKKTTLLHLVAKRDAPFQMKKLSIAESMATIKVLLGVDPNTTSSEVMKVGPTCKIRDVDCLDENGRTALHLAANVSGGIMYWLLVLAADPTIQDKDKRAVLDYTPHDWQCVKESVEKYVKAWQKMHS